MGRGGREVFLDVREQQDSMKPLPWVATSQLRARRLQLEGRPMCMTLLGVSATAHVTKKTTGRSLLFAGPGLHEGHLDTCWRVNTELHEQSRRSLEHW